MTAGDPVYQKGMVTNMKKVLSLLLTIAVSASMAVSAMAATPQESAYKLLESAQAKLNDANSMDAAFAFKLAAEAQGIKEEVSGKGSVQVILSDDSNMQMAMKMELLGETMEFYYKDGYAYYNDSFEGKYKERVSWMEGYSTASNAILGDMAQQDILDTITAEKTADGGIKISYKIKASTIKNVMDKIYKDLDLDIDFQFGNITCTYLLTEKGNVEKVTMGFPMAMSFEGETLKVTCVFAMQFRSLNEVSNIAFPKDLNTYKYL